MHGTCAYIKTKKCVLEQCQVKESPVAHNRWRRQRLQCKSVSKGQGVGLRSDLCRKLGQERSPKRCQKPNRKHVQCLTPRLLLGNASGRLSHKLGKPLDQMGRSPCMLRVSHQGIQKAKGLEMVPVLAMALANLHPWNQCLHT